MPIIPIVAYSGKKPKWSLPLDFQGSLLFGPSLLPGFEDSPGQSREAAEVWEAIKGHVLNFRCILLNLRELDLEGKGRGLSSGEGAGELNPACQGAIQGSLSPKFVCFGIVAGGQTQGLLNLGPAFVFGRSFSNTAR